jgi:DNA adenine methylase Dam
MIELKKEYLDKLYSNPFNYTGSKHRYLEALFSVLPDVENLKVLDPFLGGGDLISKLPGSWEVVASDLSWQLIGMHNGIKNEIITVDSINRLIERSNLSNDNKKAYLELRNYYNHPLSNISVNILYTLICHSNSNILRFNKSDEFNVPFGKRYFNKNMQVKLDNYQELIERRRIKFISKNYNDFDFSAYDLLLIDPPYLNTTAAYNEGGNWKKKDQELLHDKIDCAVKTGTKFVYFGQVWSNGIHNKALYHWSDKYNIKVLHDTTRNCSANKKARDGKTIEIMVYST